MFKLFFSVMLLILAAIAAGAYFHFSPIIPIFALLGLGIYGVCRGAPALTGATGLFGDTATASTSIATTTWCRGASPTPPTM